MTAVSARLVRLLNLVPYFQANPRISYEDAASDLGVSEKQLRDDVSQLFVCGLPGYFPGDLIDFAYDDDKTIEVTFSAGMDKPLRLTSPEATGLLVALRGLVDIPGVVDPRAAQSAIAKIEAAAGTVGRGDAIKTAEEGTAAEYEIEAAETGSAETGVRVRAALREARALALEYYSASRDVLSHRVVDPIRVVLVGDHSYLEAWSREAEGVRLFRFDRIVDATVLDEAAAVPEPALRSGPDTSLFDADPALPVARFLIAPAAAWMREYYPMRVVSELPDGSCEAVMTFASEEWLARLVLGFGADVRVLEPASLADRVRETAGAALAAYAELDD
ncbi:MAG: YafY family protein [Mycobacterium sp.]